MNKKCISLALAGCMFAALVLTGCSAASASKRLYFGVASQGGVYKEFGEQFAALENDSIQIKTTAGSAANLRLMMGGYLQLSIAQADLAQDAINHTGVFENEDGDSSFGAVAALYTEACQVIVLADSGIDSVEDLQGKTVSVGAEDSGSEKNAEEILSAYGLNDALVDAINLNYEDAASQLKAGKIDAMFVTTGAPSNIVEELAENAEIKFLNIDGTAAERLQAYNSAYVTYTIPAGTYDGLETDVQTVGVNAVLLAADSVPEQTIKELTETYFANHDALQSNLGVKLYDAQDASADTAIPFHSGAKAYYKSIGINID